MSIGPSARLIRRTGARTAVAAASLLLGACDPISLREVDEAAGLNGGFEAVVPLRGVDGVHGGIPVNWYFHGRPLQNGAAELTLDTESPPEGRYSLRLDVQEADSVAGARTPGFFQVVPAEPQVTYRISFWLRIRDARVLLVLRSESASEATRGRAQPLDEAAAGADRWRRFEYIYSVPEGFQNIRFELDVTRPGTVWVDDVRIEDVTG